MAVALATAGLVIAGCGGDDPLADWRDDAVAICEQATEEFRGVPGAATPEQAASAAQVALEVSQRRLDALEALALPAEGGEDAAAFIDLLELAGENLRETADALAAGDLDRIDELGTESVDLQAETAEVASDLGIEPCSPG